MRLSFIHATALGAMAALGATQAGAASYNYVTNGGFEDTSDGTAGLVNSHAQSNLTGSGTSSWDVYSTRPGWTAGAGNAGIEVQTAGTVGLTPHSGSYYVELDSDTTSTDPTNSSMSQNLVLNGGSYELSFWYSPRNGNSNTNYIEYQVLDNASSTLLLDSVTGPGAANNTSVGDWTLFSATFYVAPGASPITLSFTATGTDDTLGGFLDDIAVSAVPVPAALPLLITGLAGLGFMARRKRAA